MPELLIFGILFVIVALMWFVLAGDREQDIVDEEPTLDVQNHEGDE